MRHVRGLAVAYSFLILTPVALAATQAELNVARDKAVAWLIQNQKPSGQWSSSVPGLDIQVTATVVDALVEAGQTKTPQFAAAVAWLQNAEASSTDALARQAIALKRAGADVVAAKLITELLARRNASSGDRGWGAYPQYMASIPDTPLVMRALKANGVALTDAAVVESMFPGSSFTFGGQQRFWYQSLTGKAFNTPQEGYGEPLAPTALSVLALKENDIGQTDVTQGAAFIKGRQVTAAGATQGGISGFDGQFNPLDNALGIEALAATAAAGRADAAVLSGLDFLRRTQAADGSWQDAWGTAAALKVVASGGTALTDTDGDGVSDAIEAYLGTDPSRADGKSLALQGHGSQATGGPFSQVFSYSVVKGSTLGIRLPVSGVTACCTLSSGSLPSGVSLVVSAGGINLTGTPTDAGGFDQRITYTVTGGVEKLAQLRLEVEPTLFTVGPDFSSLNLTVSSDATLNKLRGGWQVVVNDFAGNGRNDFIAFFNGANELFNRLNCSPCTPYAGPDFGQLVGLQSFSGSFSRILPLSNNAKPPGDLLAMYVVDINNDGKKDLVLNLKRIATTSTDPADKSTQPFRSVVVLRNDTPAGGSMSFTDVTAALKLETAPEGRAVLLDANGDGVPDVVVSNGVAAAKLYVYNSSLSGYEDKSAGSGLGALTMPLAVDVDMDAANRVDVVSLDAVSGIRVYKNNGNGTFTSVANETNLTDLAARRINRLVAEDLNRDGWPEIVVFETATTGAGASQAYAGGKVSVLSHGGMNASGQPRYTLSSDAALATVSGSPDAVNTGGIVADVDDDGMADIITAGKEVSGTQYVENAIFQQAIDGSFRRLQAQTGFTAGSYVFDSPVQVDWNGDSKADLVWPNATIKGFTLLNEGDLHHSLDIVLKGKAANRNALGAKVQVSSNGVTQHKQQLATHASGPALHFGLGQALSATVTVKWPDGSQQVVNVGQVDRVVTIAQP